MIEKYVRQEFRLSWEEMRVLTEAIGESLSETQASPDTERPAILCVTKTDAENIRQRLTEELAKQGFDHEYSLTKKGEVLEALIDRFYVQ